MDSTAVKSITEAFSLILQNASKVGTPNGNPTGVNWMAILIVGALCVLGIIIVDRRATKYRNRIDAERKQERADEKAERKQERTEEKIEAAKALEDTKREAAAERERTERIAREQRERDEVAARERARTDQADRDQARSNLIQFVDTVLDKFKEQSIERIRAVEQRLGDLQSKVEANDRSVVSVEKDLTRLQDDISDLKKSLK